jgi:hypothetical protein
MNVFLSWNLPSAKRLFRKKPFLHGGKKILPPEQGHWTRDPKKQFVVEVIEVKDAKILRNKSLQNKRIFASLHRLLFLTTRSGLSY